MSSNHKVTFQIDGKTIEADRNETILQAARRYDIYIPTLCEHKDLSPFGGCRMCVIEIEGRRGLSTACTTPVAEGINVKTNTDIVKHERNVILQLLFSEHPYSCQVCEAKEDCGGCMETIRKVGITTGCNSCPSNGQCELDEVADYIGAEQVQYPNLYRYFDTETDEPFYDRDYNLCILCGRCVRMCQEIRLADVLAFKQRGPKAIVGPAFDYTHIEAGCEFCGACVTVCPTGTLSERYSKWEGCADGVVTTTCGLCSVGCQIDLEVKGGEVLRGQAVDDPLINHGQLCVLGRFSIAQLVNHYRRTRVPYMVTDGPKVELDWDEAIKLAAEKLSACPPDKFGMIVSPSSTNEDLYAAQKFTRDVMKSPNIDSSTRLFYGNGFSNYLKLFENAGTLSAIKDSDLLLAIGLDTRFGMSVVGVEIKRALENGAKLVTIHPQDHNLAAHAVEFVQPEPENLANTVKALAELSSTDSQLAKIVDFLKNSSNTVILVGTDAVKNSNSATLLESIFALAAKTGARILPLPVHTNLYGSLLMGAYPEFDPGGKPRSGAGKWNVETLADGEELDVLYVVGEMPLGDSLKAKFIIHQNVFPPAKAARANLVLPSAAFTEVDGSFVNAEGRIQRVRQAVAPPGQALPDWDIFSKIASQLGAEGFEYTCAEDVHNEIAAKVERFSNLHNLDREAAPATFKLMLNGHKANGQNHLFGSSGFEHTYKGLPLTALVKDLHPLFPQEVIALYGEAIKQPAEEPLHHVEEIEAGTGRFRVLESKLLVPNIHTVTVEAPEVARAIKPGEFVIVRAEEDGERIPLSASDFDPEKGTVTMIFMNAGRSTSKLAGVREGKTIPTVAGPLGNPFEIKHYGSVMLVGGCYGIGSIYPVARALKEAGNKVYITIEARYAYLFYWEEKLKSVADELFYITRDGSLGYRGHVKKQLPKIIKSLDEDIDLVILNGCNFLLRYGSSATEGLGIKTMVSLNTLMIDGTGMCGVCRLTVDGETKFACVDGPYFDGHLVDWKELLQRRKSYIKEETVSLKLA